MYIIFLLLKLILKDCLLLIFYSMNCRKKTRIAMLAQKHKMRRWQFLWKTAWHAGTSLIYSLFSPVNLTASSCLLKNLKIWTCSGCVTSAETVMLEKQSLDEFLSHCRNSEEKVIVSVSPQSRASLASFFDLSPTQVLSSTRIFYMIVFFYLLNVSKSLCFTCALKNIKTSSLYLQDISFMYLWSY